MPSVLCKALLASMALTACTPPTKLSGQAVSSTPAAVDRASPTEDRFTRQSDCPSRPLPPPQQLPLLPTLPDPFVGLNGVRIARKSQWRCRREEILAQAQQYIYGHKPPSGEVSGQVDRTAIQVAVSANGRRIEFRARVVLPTVGAAPYPAIVHVGTGPSALGEQRLLDLGVAVVYYDHYALGREGVPEQSRGKPNPGKFYDLFGATHSAGLLMAWAWGASRLIDALAQSPSQWIDTTRLGVTGCSRHGKGAFAIGLFDDRVALTIPQETSTAGVVAYRLVDRLNTERTDHNFYGLNWLSDNFEPFVYTDNKVRVDRLPLDTHSLVAAMAPRGLLVLDNPHQRQMSAPAGHLAVLAGAEVYQALGVGDRISYHSAVRDTPHCSYKREYTDSLTRNIARFLHGRKDVPTGDFAVHPSAQSTLASWRQWTTPTLAD